MEEVWKEEGLPPLAQGAPSLRWKAKDSLMSGLGTEREHWHPCQVLEGDEREHCPSEKAWVSTFPSPHSIFTFCVFPAQKPLLFFYLPLPPKQ
jgi:hypothetical protein